MGHRIDKWRSYVFAASIAQLASSIIVTLAVVKSYIASLPKESWNLIYGINR